MNWKIMRPFPWLDTRARFVASSPRSGTLLDLGSSDGETLSHMAELRPDIKFHAVDIKGSPENYPADCEFYRADLENSSLPWNDGYMDRVTCMHLIEHLHELNSLFAEVARVLKPGGYVYFETPHPRSVDFPSPSGRQAGKFTLNFYDDKTHIEPVPVDQIAALAHKFGLNVVRSGISRNLLFSLSYGVFFFLPESRKKLTAYVHLKGWSAYAIAQKPHG